LQLDVQGLKQQLLAAAEAQLQLEQASGQADQVQKQQHQQLQGEVQHLQQQLAAVETAPKLAAAAA